MMKRIVMITLALAGLGVLVWLQVDVAGERRVQDPDRAESIAPAESSLSVDLAAAPETPASEPVANPVERTAAEPAPKPESAQPKTRPSKLARGTIVVRDAAGREFPAEDGTLFVESPDGTTEVPVRAGAFELEARRKSFFDRFGGDSKDFWAQSAILGERTTLLDEQLQLWGGETVALYASWPARLELRVISSVDGRDLDGVDVVGDFGRFASRPHPGAQWESRAVARGVPSPLVLPPPRTERIVRDNPFRTYLVRAPGHAWTPVLLNLEEGGRATAELLPGGHLVVSCEGLDPERLPTIEVTPADGKNIEQRLIAPALPDASGQLRFESLAAGAWRIQATIETPTKPQHVLATERVELEVGAELSVVLTLAMPPLAAICPLDGWVVFPKGYGFGAPVVMVRPLSAAELAGGFDWPGPKLIGPCELSRIRGEDRTWAWTAEDVPQGTVEISVQGTGVSMRLELGPGGARDVELVCPPPANVELVVRSDHDGRPLGRADSLSVLPANGPPFSTLEYGKLDRVGDKGPYRGKLAPGSYDVALFELGVPVEDARIEVRPGRNAFELTVKASNLIRLRLMNGEVPVAAEASVFERAEQDGELVTQNVSYLNSMESTISLGLLGQGRMVLHLRAPVGYMPIEPVEIDVLPGEVTEVDVQVRVKE